MSLSVIDEERYFILLGVEDTAIFESFFGSEGGERGTGAFLAAATAAVDSFPFTLFNALSFPFTLFNALFAGVKTDAVGVVTEFALPDKLPENQVDTPPPFTAFKPFVTSLDSLGAGEDLAIVDATGLVDTGVEDEAGAEGVVEEEPKKPENNPDLEVDDSKLSAFTTALTGTVGLDVEAGGATDLEGAALADLDEIREGDGGEDVLAEGAVDSGRWKKENKPAPALVVPELTALGAEAVADPDDELESLGPALTDGAVVDAAESRGLAGPGTVGGDTLIVGSGGRAGRDGRDGRVGSLMPTDFSFSGGSPATLFTATAETTLFFSSAETVGDTVSLEGDFKGSTFSVELVSAIGFVALVFSGTA